MKRKYNFSHLTDEQLQAIAAKYPRAVETVTIVKTKPVYRVLAMLVECGAELPEDVTLVDETPAFLKGKSDAK